MFSEERTTRCSANFSKSPGHLQPKLCLAKSSAHKNPIARLGAIRSEEHTSELQSRLHLVCRLLLEKTHHPCPRPRDLGAGGPVRRMALVPRRTRVPVMSKRHRRRELSELDSVPVSVWLPQEPLVVA